MDDVFNNYRDVFRNRPIINLPTNIEEFSEIASEFVRYEEKYQINILPALMVSLLRNSEFQKPRSMADMIVYGLDMPPADLYSQESTKKIYNLLKPEELKFFQMWILAIEEMDFVQVCRREYKRVVDFWINQLGNSSLPANSPGE